VARLSKIHQRSSIVLRPWLILSPRHMQIVRGRFHAELHVIAYTTVGNLVIRSRLKSAADCRETYVKGARDD
jgi:hypothetical protein